jgi:hypothetical protein
VDDTVLEALAFVVGTLVGLQNYEQSVVPTVSLIPAISKEKLENHPMTHPSERTRALQYLVGNIMSWDMIFSKFLCQFRMEGGGHIHLHLGYIQSVRALL